jgi:hypothetical protein
MTVFRNVSFQYPDRETFALQNVSFKIEASQLCVSLSIFAIFFITGNVGNCWRKRLWKEYDFETHFPHLRSDRGHDSYR